MKKTGLIISIFLLFVMFSAIFIPQAIAAPNLADELEAIEDADSVLDANGGDDAKDKIRGLSKDAMDIVGIVVMSLVAISGLWTAVKFTNAGDSPQQKMVLKGAVAMHIIGIVFLANYFGFIAFSFDKLKIF